MPKVERPIQTFGEQKQVKKIVAALLVATGLGGAALQFPPAQRDAAVAVGHRPAADAVPGTAAVKQAPAPVAKDSRPAPAAAQAPVSVTKNSSAQDIVRAIVSQGQAAKLNEDQIKTVIATAKIESTFRPTASGGVQAYGGSGGAADEVIGLFQEKASFGTVAERQDPNKAIARFITRFTDSAMKYRVGSDSVLAATLAQNPQLFKYRSRGVGTDYYNTVKAAKGEAAALYGQSAGTKLPPVT